MGKIKASYVTDKGKQMLFSGGTVNYTKAVLYSQDVSNLTVSDLRQLTSPTGELMTTPVGVSDKQDGSTSSVNVEATFTNAGLDHDIEFHSVGWFAKQGDNGTETLMAVQVANNGANLAAGSPNGATDAVDLTLSFAIGDTTTVTAVIDPAGSPTFTDLHNSANDIRSELHTALATKADKSDLEPLAKSADVNKALDTKADKSQLPDLTPYAKSADVNASLDTKADKQTVADDLAKKADQSDVNEKLATKADTEAVDEALSKKADKTDLDPLAKSADIAADVKSLQASIDTKADQDATTKALATKADQSTIDSNIKSINDELALKANISDVSKNLATKANQSSLDETNAEVAKKANSEDVTKQLATKANVSDVDDALSKKDDTADVDQKIATVNKSVSDLSDTVSANKTATDASLATKANASDVADNVKTLQANIDTKADKATVDAEIAKIDFTPYAKSADVAKDLQGYTTTADLTKLLAGKRDIADSYSRDELDKKFLQLSTDTSGKVSADQIAKLLASKVDKTDLTSQLQAITDSIGTKANSANVTAELAKKDNTADVDAKIKTVTDLANTKANSVDVTAALDKKDDTSDVDAKIKVVTDLTNTKANANDVYNRSTVDNAFTEVRGRLSKLEGTQTLDSPDFNGITASGIYYITNNNGANIKNNPVDQWGVLIVSNGNGHRVSQVYYPDDGNPPWYRLLDESTWRSWYQLSTRYDVNNAVSLATKAQDTANQANTNISKIDLSPYAKSADVNSELANKASTTDVSNGLAGKADKSQVNVDGDLFSAPGSITSWASLQADGRKNVLRSVRTEGQATDFNTGNWDAGILFGGNNTKALISVGYQGNTARVTGGSDYSVWHEDIAWKSDVTNLQNQVNTKASASDVNSLNQTISALQQTVQSLQNTVNQQATQITGLQTLVNNQAQEIKQLQETTIKGKTFSKSQEAAAEAWEQQNSQQIAFILDN